MIQFEYYLFEGLSLFIPVRGYCKLQKHRRESTDGLFLPVSLQLQRRHEQMKKNLEAQHKELEEKRRVFEEERANWEAQQRLEQQKLEASRYN